MAFLGLVIATSRSRTPSPFEAAGKNSMPASPAVGARLHFLPPYSPDFNWIEMAFAKLEALLREPAERIVEICGRPSAGSSTP
jgi:transposase